MNNDFTIGIDNLPMPQEVAIIPPLPYIYTDDDETRDSRVDAILDQVAEFCEKEFTEVPPDSDGTDNPNYDPNDPDNPENPPKEGGDIMPLDDDNETGEKPKPGDPDFVIDPDDPDKEGQIDPDIPGEPYPEQTDELDKLRQAYKEAKEKNLEEKKSYWSVLWQVIRFISDYTCWTESYNDTFILQARTQTYTMSQLPYCSQFLCNCRINKPIDLPLTYAPLDQADLTDFFWQDCQVKAFIRGSIEYMNRDGEFVIEPISNEYLQSHYNPHTQKIVISPKDFEAFYAGKCECPEDITIIIHYNAGYLTIPPALLPLICQLIGRIEDSKKPLSDCHAAMTQVAGLLKSKKVGNIQYTWSDNDTESQKTQALFTQIYNIASVAELEGLSRCAIVNVEEAGDVI